MCSATSRASRMCSEESKRSVARFAPGTLGTPAPAGASGASLCLRLVVGATLFFVGAADPVAAVPGVSAPGEGGRGGESVGDGPRRGAASGCRCRRGRRIERKRAVGLPRSAVDTQDCAHRCACVHIGSGAGRLGAGRLCAAHVRRSHVRRSHVARRSGAVRPPLNRRSRHTTRRAAAEHSGIPTLCC